MNPANLPNSGAAGGPMPTTDKPKPDNSQMLLKHVGQVIQAQGPFTGWRESVPIQERIVKVCQMISSLRLIPTVEGRVAISAALKFEEKALREAKTKPDYERECNEKLLQLRDKRQQAIMSQSNPQVGLPINTQATQNQMQHMFPNAMPRPTQGTPMPMQQQQALSAPPNQQPLPQQAFLQNPQARPVSMQLRDDISSLSQKESQYVCHFADQLAQKTSPADMEKIKMNLQNMTADQRQFLNRKGLTPMQYFFRCQALKTLRKHRQAMGMANPQTMNLDAANTAGGERMMTTHQRQLSQPSMSFQGSPAMPMAGLDPSFSGNVDHVQPQQVDALRSQETGQPAMSAHNPQMMSHPPFGSQQGAFQGPHPNVNRTNMNAAMMAQQHRQNLQNAQQDKLQHAAHFQAQSDAQARAQAAAKAQRAISSQANPQIPQSMPQQNPAVSMMNRPGAPVQVPQGGMGPQGRPYARPGGMGQNNQNPMQTPRPPIPPGLPQNVQNHLAQLPPEQVNGVLQNYRRAMANNPAMLRQNHGVPVQPPIPDSAQMAQVPSSNMVNDPNMRASMGMHYPLMNMGGMQPQPGLQGQQFPMQKPNQPFLGYPQPPDPRLEYLQQRSSTFTMNEDQLREMDKVPFPFAIFNSNPAVAQALPKNLKTWGQLKMWASKNPQALGEISVDRLAMLQKLHFGQMLSARREAANRAMGQPTAAPPVGMDQSGLRQPHFGPQHMHQQLPGQPQVPHGMPVMRPITANDIHMARQKLGAHVEKLSDDALRVLLEKSRHKQYMTQAARNREAAQALAAQSMNQVPTPGQIPVPTQPPQHIPTTQAQPQVSQPTSAPGMPSMDSKSGPQNVANTARAAAVKPSPKSLKRPSVPDTENKAPVPHQPQVPTVPLGGGGGGGGGGQPPQASPAQSTRESMAAMSQQQRPQWEAHLRRQQAQPRISKDAADEAWARLPEPLKQMYAELVRNDNAVVPVAMTSAQKAAVTQQLRENTYMLSRMDTLVQWISKFPGQEKNVRTLLQMRMLLMKQFKGPDWTLADHFTIASDYLANAIAHIKKWFAEMISRVQSSRLSQTSSRTAAVQPGITQQASPKGPTPLNASNLQQLEQQEAALQRARKAAQTIPPAPTTVQPPFPLGATSPQGVPRVYGPTSVTQESLTLPPPKRRKPNQAAAKAPAKSAEQRSPAVKAETPAAPEAKRPVSVPKDTFKCSIVECKYHIKGFPSQAALDNHVNEEHKPEEPITNALDFAIESYRKGLGLDKADEKPLDANEQRPRDSATLGGKAQQPSKPGMSITPSSSQPMAQTSSLAGAKSISPSSLQRKPSQMSSAKEHQATSAELKRVPSKDAKKPPGNTAETGLSPPAAKDPWEDSPTSLEAIRSTFGELAEQSFFDVGWDRVDELLLSDAFTAMRSKDTPQSTDASAVTQTPQDSDVSKDEDLDMVMDMDDSWALPEWVNLPDDLEGSLYMNEPWEPIDWDAVVAGELEPGRAPGEDLVYSV
uniref:Mediator complex subunit 15 KIX domain-containing protein n=1 Tax=Coccidioides posadasii RMSCC 3488 TaxID=454284 RepID=A0A0J6FV45_COCPO|nr:hypothetical protein CPAG_09318 [Coccidioides posadasii RMSCC 3488]